MTGPDLIGMLETGVAHVVECESIHGQNGRVIFQAPMGYAEGDCVFVLVHIPGATARARAEGKIREAHP